MIDPVERGSAQGWLSVGRGIPLWSGDPVIGTACAVSSVEDVLRLMTDPPADMVLFAHSASATIFAPLLGDAIAVLCTSGTVGSHLAILAREFGIACIMGATLDDARLAGKKVQLLPSGEVLLERVPD